MTYNRGKQGTNPLDKDFEPQPGGVTEGLGGDELQSLNITWGGGGQLFREGDLWQQLETILANCDAAMLRHGWDRKAGNGRDFPGDRNAEPFSELWYAGKIGFECWHLLTWHRKHGPNEIALSQAMYLGRLLTEAEWRAAFKPSITRGRKEVSDSQKGADLRNSKHWAERQRRFVRLQELLIDGMLLETAVQQCEVEGLGKADAIKRQWNRAKEKRDT